MEDSSPRYRFCSSPITLALPVIGHGTPNLAQFTYVNIFALSTAPSTESNAGLTTNSN